MVERGRLRWGHPYDEEVGAGVAMGPVVSWAGASVVRIPAYGSRPGHGHLSHRSPRGMAGGPRWPGRAGPSSSGGRCDWECERGMAVKRSLAVFQQVAGEGGSTALDPSPPGVSARRSWGSSRPIPGLRVPPYGSLP